MFLCPPAALLSEILRKRYRCQYAQFAHLAQSPQSMRTRQIEMDNGNDTIQGLWLGRQKRNETVVAVKLAIRTYIKGSYPLAGCSCSASMIARSWDNRNEQFNQ